MSTAPQTAPRWRREPHRLLFPFGAGLGVVAVLPFAWRGGAGGAVALFHSVAQIQGFLTCFVVGFLLAFVPRHTRTAPAEGWEVLSAVALPALAALSAWMGDAVLASWVWLVLLVIVLVFTVRRLRARPGSVQPAPVLLWVPVSLAAGAVGALLVAGGAGTQLGRTPAAWSLGRGLLVQGFVTGLVLGIGGYLLPQVTRGEPPREGSADPARLRRSAAFHAAAAVVFFGSFPLELLGGPRLGFGLRALTSGAVLLGSARIHRPPLLPGLHRWLMLVAAWLVPVAFAFGAAAPGFRGAALHVLFVGGFAQITLAVSAHVVAWRDDRPPRASWRGAASAVMATLLAAAFAARILAALDLRHVAGWLEVAAYAFCAAIVAWAALVGPALVAGDAGAHRGTSTQ